MTEHGKLLGMIGLTAAITMTGTAHAQDTNVAAPANQDGEIVVTAQRTSQLLEKAPIAVTALTAESLERANIYDVKSLSAHAPNFNIGVNGTTSGLDIGIRGITTQNDDWAGNPAISVSVDGVYVPRTQGLNQGLYDLERVEILRGPQGTLYGRNATGGAVNIITARPKFDDFHASGDISYGNYEAVIAHLTLNFPLSDRFAIRASGMFNRDAGVVNTHFATGTVNSPTGPSGAATENYGKADQWGGRISALWKPTDRLSIAVSVDRAQDLGTPALPVSTPLTAQTYRFLLFPPPFFAPTLTPVTSANQTDPFDRTVNIGGSLDLRLWNVRTNINYDFGGGWGISVVAGYGELSRSSVLDADGTNVNNGNARNRDRERSAYQEATLHYENDQLKWLFGASHFVERQSGDLAIDQFGPQLFPNGAPQFPVTLQFYHPDNRQEAYGLFSQATYSLTPDFRVTGGVRYSHDERAFRGAEGTYFCPLQTALDNLAACNPLWTPASGPPNFGPQPGQFSQPNARAGEWSNVSWKVGLDYDLDPRTLAYLSAGTGYKAGGLGEGLFIANYDPEKVLSFEAGIKTRSSDNAVRLSASAFYMKYDNYQVSQTEAVAYFPSSIPGFPVAVTNLITRNAAKATIYGLEVDGSWRISPNDRLDGFIALLDASFDEFAGAVDLIAQPGNPAAGILPPRLDLSGNSLIRSPNFSARINYEHSFRFANGGELRAGASAYWQSRVFLREVGSPIDEQKGYGLVDASLTYILPGENWQVEAFAKNLTDTRYRVAEFAAVFSENSLYGQPRTYGMRVKFSY